MFSPKFKATAPKSGIWSPNNRSEPSQLNVVSLADNHSGTNGTSTPIWTPKSVQSSPTLCRKGFRSVPFESPTLQRKFTKESTDSVTHPPWESHSDTINPTVPSKSEANNSVQRLVHSYSSPGINNLEANFGQYRKGWKFPSSHNRREDPVEQPESRQLPGQKPTIANEVAIERESLSGHIQSNDTLHLNTAQRISSSKAMPMLLRSEVKENDQSNWYKQVYNTIHKQPSDEDFVTVRYKTRRGRPYKSSGYASEPEPNYDSDYCPRRSPLTTINQFSDKSSYGTLPTPIRPFYRINPGRIENYTPGHSSVSDRETKQWWDEVMDIFDGETRINRAGEGHLSRAFKEKGYESDTSLVFRKKENSLNNSWNPDQQREVYKSVQAGGEPPLQGFRKPAPEKPKDPNYDDIMTRTTRITDLPGESTSKSLDRALLPMREILCYPITNISRPLDLFGAFPKQIKTFVPIRQSPPPPPFRNSSKANSTLKIYSEIKTSKAKPVLETKEAYSIMLKKDLKNFSNSSKLQMRKQCIKTNQIAPKRSPRISHSPVAFGRSISKERTFAEEKKRIEESLPQCRKIKNLTTRILRKADLKSPDEVKKAIRNTIRYGNVIEKVNHLSKSNDSTITKFTVNSPNKMQSKMIMNWVARGQNALGITKIRASRTRNVKAEEPKLIESKSLIRSKHHSASNISLPRTNSTFSINSTKSTTKKKEPISKKNEPVGSTYISSRSRKETKSVKEVVDTKNRLVKFDCGKRRNIVQKSLTPKESRLIESNTFFQTYNNSGGFPRATTVLERARIWNQFTAKSEPSLRPIQVYLSAKRPVSSSKFKLSDYARGRSLSPRRPLLPISYVGHMSKFDSFTKVSHEEDEFENTETTQNYYSYQERSRSEPPTITFMTQIVKPDSPLVIHGRKTITESDFGSRSISPVRIISRSPSYHDAKSLTRKVESKPVNRSRSLCTPYHQKQELSLAEVQSQSTKSLHEPEKCYHQKSERFRELNQFYSNLERIGQLERATSQTDLKPIRKQEEIIDFDLWKKIRCHEKAEKELNYLIGKLKKEQKEKDLHFKPHDVDEIRWEPTKESGLRIKEKSVEDLKELFLHKSNDPKRKEIEMEKDSYRSLWKGSSVLDVASSIENKYQSSEVSSTKPASPLHSFELFGLSRNLISTLSNDQISKLKVQLKAIYSVDSSRNRGQNGPTYNTLPSTKKMESTSIRSASLPKHSTMVQKRSKDDFSKPVTAMTETEKKRLSQDFCQEIKNVFEQKKNRLVRQEVRSQSLNVYDKISDKTPTKLDDECGSEVTTITVIHRPKDNIKDKIQYFEDKNVEKSGTTIYHARDYSSPDEEEIMAAINLKMQKKKSQEKSLGELNKSQSQSFTDLKEIFGEKHASTTHYSKATRSLSPYSGPKSIDVIISNSSDPTESCEPGKVRKITTNFEIKKMNFPMLLSCPPKRTLSDPDLFQSTPRLQSSSLTRVKGHEIGDVTWMTHKFETKNMTNRSRCRTRRVTSPTSRVVFKNDNRYMPHIDIISKTASLKRDIKKMGSTIIQSDQTGEVQKIRQMFENKNRLSILGKMYTSVPDITELREVCRYLSGPWFAHRYPHPGDNKRSLSSPVKTGPVVEIVEDHYGSNKQSFRNDFVSNSKTERIQLYRELKENTVVPPPPPIKGVSQFQGYQQYDEFDSPRRYVENNINIHYKSPTRHEVKETLPFEELQRRQAETMKQIYEQERQRKYLQELDDIAKRRHTDNFIPSQKSPISSTRFDDFAHREGTKVEPSRIVAKALYNFDGQSNKELSFKKGDIIYIRRQIDKNWYEGTHNANFGLLPVSYVEVISRDGTIIQQKPKSKDGLARAKYNFTAQSAIELSLNKGELVTLTRRVDENWYEGRIANRKGIIPVSYVEVISDIGEENRASPVTSQMSTISDTPPQRLSKTVKKTEILHVDTNSDPIAYRAIYRYRPQNTDELELQEGDIIFVLEKCDDGWFVGTSERTGCFGTFPGNYVEQI